MTELKLILVMHAYGGSTEMSYQQMANICGVDRRTAMRSIATLLHSNGKRPAIISVRQVKAPGKFQKNIFTLRGYSTGIKSPGIWTLEEILTSYQDNLRVIRKDFQNIARNIKEVGGEFEYHEIGDAETAVNVQAILKWLQEKKAKIKDLDKFVYNWIVRGFTVKERKSGIQDIPEGVSYAD